MIRFKDQKRGKISAQPHTSLCIQFLNRENNDYNNTLPLGKQICFTIAWGCAEILPKKIIEFEMDKQNCASLVTTSPVNQSPVERTIYRNNTD